jgi:hypothetical protein
VDEEGESQETPEMGGGERDKGKRLIDTSVIDSTVNYEYHGETSEKPYFASAFEPYMYQRKQDPMV